jgi:hypothetical protein
MLQIHFQGVIWTPDWIGSMGFDDVMANEYFMVSEWTIKELFHFGYTDCKEPCILKLQV